jgi:PTH1 family peptidyl-tRNA hydrolase
MLKPTKMAVIGLGNVGPRFDWTPHNAGFAVLDRLAARLGGTPGSVELENASAVDVTIGDVTVTLVKPTTGMNNSGLALDEIMRVLELDFPEILIVFDDLSLPLGKMRFRDNGRQTAGHRGVASLLSFVPEHRLLSRLKLGVGPDPGGADRLNYVLSPLPESRRPHYDKVLDAAAQAVETWAVEGLLPAMNRYNSKEITP